MNINSLEILNLFKARLALDISEKYATNQPADTHIELLNLCKNYNITEVNQKIKDFPEYKDYIPKISINEFVEDSLKLLNKLWEQKLINNVRLASLAELFASAPIDKNIYCEEEIEKVTYSHLTPNIKNYLEKMDSLFKKNVPSTMSIKQLESFAQKFKNLTQQLGICKFQQYFDKQNKTIDKMIISSSHQTNQYQINFSLSSADKEQSHLTLSESVNESPNVSNYFQNLCFSYLVAQDTINRISNHTFGEEEIRPYMSVFSTCYKGLREMAKYKINIFQNKKVIFSDESQFEASELELNAPCQESPLSPSTNSNNSKEIHDHSR